MLSGFELYARWVPLTFDKRSLFSVLTVLTTKLHCTMSNNFQRDLQLIEYEQRIVRIGNNYLKNRRLIEYAIAYCNSCSQEEIGPIQSQHHINYLEMLAILLGLQIFAKDKNNTHFGITGDNTTAVNVITAVTTNTRPGRVFFLCVET